MRDDAWMMHGDAGKNRATACAPQLQELNSSVSRTLNPNSETRNPKPETRNPKSETLNRSC
jgi:hypothetical protein